jgi:hypothetical protein
MGRVQTAGAAAGIVRNSGEPSTVTGRQTDGSTVRHALEKFPAQSCIAPRYVSAARKWQQSSSVVLIQEGSTDVRKLRSRMPSMTALDVAIFKSHGYATNRTGLEASPNRSRSHRSIQQKRPIEPRI